MSSTACRVCGGELAPFLDLGDQPLSNHFAPAEEASPFRFRLEVASCRACTMVQLVNEVPRDLMFREDYPYLSSGSVHGSAHFEAAAKNALGRELTTATDPFAVEIGCNDGVFLRHIADAGVRHLGVDPSAEVVGRAESLGVDVRVDFFDEALAGEVREAHGPAKFVYAANTLCHIPYIGSVLDGVRALLDDDGVFWFEDPYLGDILEKGSFDQIYDEHFYYFSATSVQQMAHRHGLELVDLWPLAVHGGELRYALAKTGARTPSPVVAETVERERALGVLDPSRLEGFAQTVQERADSLVQFLATARDNGQRVVGYGATAKSATVLNYCGIGADLLPVIYDSTPTKQGRVTPGTHIPVEPPAGFHEQPADFALLLAWNHADEIMLKETQFRESGGQWLLYVPSLRTV